MKRCTLGRGRERGSGLGYRPARAGNLQLEHVRREPDRHLDPRIRIVLECAQKVLDDRYPESSTPGGSSLGSPVTVQPRIGRRRLAEQPVEL